LNGILFCSEPASFSDEGSLCAGEGRFLAR
jgi:hypothetical protein